MKVDSITIMGQECVRVRIPIRPCLRKEECAVLDVELAEFGEVACLGYYRMGDFYVTQFIFLDPIPARDLATSDFFKYAILGSNTIICYFAPHERGLFGIPSERMIETMSRPYYPKELAIKLQSLDMVSSKFLPPFNPATAKNIACHNAGCIIKILLLMLGHDSFNRIDFAPKMQQFFSQNIGGLDIGIPFTDLFDEQDIAVIEFILSPDRSIIEYVCYFDFQSKFIRVVRMECPVDGFMDTEVWHSLEHKKKFASLSMDLLRCIIHVPDSRYYSLPLSPYSKIDEFLSIKGLNNSAKPSGSDFDRVFYAYSQVVKASMLFLMGGEFSNIHFKRLYYTQFMHYSQVFKQSTMHSSEAFPCRA